MNFPAGWEEANMPGLQRLKANGITFTHAYSNSVTCSPARASMLTGLMPPQHRVRFKLRYDMPSDKFPQEELPTDIANWATVAKAAGYTTVYKGKIDAFKGPNSTIAKPFEMEKYGFGRWNPPDSGLGNGVPEFGGCTAPEAGNDDRYMRSRAANESEVAAGLEGALQYVAEVAPLQQPFFLVVSLINPHDITGYPSQLFTKAGCDPAWLEGDLPLPPTAGESLLPTKPYAQWDFNRIFDILIGPVDTAEKQRNYVNLYGSLLKVADANLVELLDALAPLINDTLIIKTSDHGETGLSHELTRQKCYNYYEESARVPLVYSNPRLFPEPLSSDALVSHIDLLPTLAELLGKPKIAPFTGLSYASILLGTSSAIQDYVVFSMEDYQIGQAAPPYVQQPSNMMCIREVDWKYCKYYDNAAEITKVRSVFEMYNLKADPNESVNLASPYHNRTAFEEKNYVRLNRKLKEVKRTRLAPRPVVKAIALTLNVTATAPVKGSPGTVQRTGTLVGRPVGNGNFTLTSAGGTSGPIKVVISSGSGIIRGRATTKGAAITVEFTSGTGTYQVIAGKGLKYADLNNGIVTILGEAKY